MFKSTTRRIKLLIVTAACLSIVSISCSRRKEQPPEPAPTTLAEFTQATAGKNALGVARFVLERYDCKKCHALDSKQKLILNQQSEAMGKDFHGCIPMLSDMNVISQVSAKDRTPQETETAKHFQEYGCAFCHKIVPGKMGLTDIGDKLGFFHKGCNEGFCCLDTKQD